MTNRATDLATRRLPPINEIDERLNQMIEIRDYKRHSNRWTPQLEQLREVDMDQIIDRLLEMRLEMKRRLSLASPRGEGASNFYTLNKMTDAP